MSTSSVDTLFNKNKSIGQAHPASSSKFDGYKLRRSLQITTAHMFVCYPENVTQTLDEEVYDSRNVLRPAA